MTRTSDRSSRRTLWDTRLNLCRLVMTGSFVLLAAALGLFQVLWSDQYVGLALKNRLRLLRIPPSRGQIYDRNRVPLALNVMNFEIMGYPLDLRKKEIRERFLASLERAHLPHDPEQLERRIRNLAGAPYRAISLISNLTMLQTTSLMEDPSFPQELFPLPQWKRSYPAGALTAHVVGYVGEISERELQSAEPAEHQSYAGGDMIGKAGIERYYEHLLRGSVGERAIEVDARGRQRKVLNETPPGIGKDITLTLDLGAQQKASALMEGYQGAMVVLDVNSGEVIVMYSNPTYDPNPISWGLTRDEWSRLILDPARPMLNRAVSGQYSPGSVFKVLTGYAALECGAVERDTVLFCPGIFSLSNTSYRCWRRSGHGRETFEKALRDSCDVYFYETSQSVGVKKYNEVGARFGLGAPLGIDLPGEAPGLMPGPEWKKKTVRESWYRGDTVNMSIGQGYVLMTPLQIASLYAMIANGGVFYRPHLLKSDRAAGEDRGLSPEHLRLVQRGLKAVVAKGGTGHAASVDGVDMVGKTGTVQHAHGKDHAVFAGYAPADSPRYAAVCFIEGGESGGRVAGPLVGQMLEYLLRDQERKRKK